MTFNFELIHRRDAEAQRKTNCYYKVPAAHPKNSSSAPLRRCGEKDFN